jgi:hypothetical protein
MHEPYVLRRDIDDPDTYGSGTAVFDESLGAFVAAQTARAPLPAEDLLEDWIQLVDEHHAPGTRGQESGRCSVDWGQRLDSLGWLNGPSDVASPHGESGLWKTLN